MSLDLNDLGQFTGSETVFRHSLMRRVTYTEGAKHVADTAGAHWLLDIIATNQMTPEVRQEEFQVWDLKVSGSTAKIICEDGNDKAVFTQDIDYTDFPAPGIKFYFTNNVIMLPSEY